MYLRIEDHGIIGDLYTAALVGTDGTIDWFCAPNFDSPSIFGSILDDEKGGHFSLRPTVNDVRSTQYYLPETNVLVTHFTSDEGVAQVVDFMPVRTLYSGDADHVLIRRVTGIRGNLHMSIDCSPRFNYGMESHYTVPVGDSVRFVSPDIAVEYWSTIPPKIEGDSVKVDFEIHEGHTEYIVIDAVEHVEEADKFDAERIELLFDDTVDYWRRWINKCTYTGRWARDGASLRARSEAPYVRTDRRVRRRADDKPAGRPRWGPELGLPLHLDSGCRIQRLRTAPHRVDRRSGAFHGLVAGSMLTERRRRHLEDHVWHRRPA